MAENQATILDGAQEPGFPAVGALVDLTDLQNPRPYCTATLVAASWVLTAAHCVDGREPAAVGFSLDLVALADRDWRSVPRYRTVAGLHPRPDYTYRSAVPTYSVHDLALVELESQVFEVEPIEWAAGPLDDALQDATVLHVGLGASSETDADSIGTKRSASLVVDEVGVFTFSDRSGAHGLCHGDSGSPVFLYEDGQPRLVGVSSLVTATSDAAGCSGTYTHSRLDRYQAWLGSLLDGAVSCDTENTGCACPHACLQDGYCNNEACRVQGCARTFACLSDCPSIGGACETSCLAQATDAAVESIASIHACSKQRCQGHAEAEDYYACMRRQCAPELGECGFAGCSMATEDCGEAAACLPTRSGMTDCRPSDGLADGQPCDWSWDRNPCKNGLVCGGSLDGSGECRKACQGDADCDGAQRCVETPLAGGWSLGTCAAVDPRDERLPDESAPAYACAFVPHDKRPGGHEGWLLLAVLGAARVARRRAVGSLSTTSAVAGRPLCATLPAQASPWMPRSPGSGPSTPRPDSSPGCLPACSGSAEG